MCKQIASGKIIYINGKNEVRESLLSVLKTGEIINSHTYASLGNRKRIWEVLNNLSTKSHGILILGEEIYFIGDPTFVMNENKLEGLTKQYKTTEISFTYSNWQQVNK